MLCDVLDQLEENAVRYGSRVDRRQPERCQGHLDVRESLRIPEFVSGQGRDPLIGEYLP